MWPFSSTKKLQTPVIENIVTKIFDVSSGWKDEKGQIEVERRHSHEDGNPIVDLRVGRIICHIFQQAQEIASTTRGSPAFRWDKICMVREVDGVEIKSAAAILTENFETHGYPCIGADEEGRLSLHMAIPVMQNFPIDVLRSQIMMAAVVMHEAEDGILSSIEGDDGKSDRSGFDMAGLAKKAALLALSFALNSDFGGEDA